jgi:hypothetical protein
MRSVQTSATHPADRPQASAQFSTSKTEDDLVKATIKAPLPETWPNSGRSHMYLLTRI